MKAFLLAFLFPVLVAAKDLPDFAKLAEKVNVAVVSIQTKQNPKSNPYQDPMVEFLERFYGLEQRRRQPAQALGSGFIIEKNGLIITNNHVVDKADEIEVQLSFTDKKFKAEIVGKDPRTDIALIKIKADKDLPTLPLGSSEEAKVGEWVAAFGNPLGFTHTITKGIISAKGRDVQEIGLFPFIQTDASINPGNSGGPLVNMKGEVIGVNTFIIQGAQGLGFATPIDGVKLILDELKTKGRVTRGYLGLAYTPLDPRAANYLGLKNTNGIIVGDVYAGGPADKAGIKPYDVITEFAGQKIDSPNALPYAVAKQKIGSVVNVKVVRDKKELTLKVKIEQPPEDFGLTQKDVKDNKSLPKGTKAPHGLGFYTTPLTQSLAKQLNIPFVNKPVIIDIETGSPADQAGLARGDILLDINRKTIRTVKDVQKALRKGSNLIRVQRGNYRVALFIEG